MGTTRHVNFQMPQQPVPSPLRPANEPSPTPSTFSGKSKLTERFDYLSDGADPTYQQWRISIMDRFLINGDHYSSDLTRKNLVWSTTKGAARTYLMPRYNSGTPNEYRTAAEMLETLKSYFVSGLEKENHRDEFHALEMSKGKDVSPNETFQQFSARFKNMAILGNIAGDDWFYQLWEKITPALRLQATASKHLWNENFQTMVNSLSAIDMERRRNNERSPPSTSRNAPSGGNNKSAANTGAATKSAPKRFRPFTSTTTGPAPAFKPTVKFSTSTIPPPQPTLGVKDNVCHLCHQPGYWKRECPNVAAVKAMIYKIEQPPLEDMDVQDEQVDDFEDALEGNEEA